jgi:hypothetical protein
LFILGPVAQGEHLGDPSADLHRELLDLLLELEPEHGRIEGLNEVVEILGQELALTDDRRAHQSIHSSK